VTFLYEAGKTNVLDLEIQKIKIHKGSLIIENDLLSLFPSLPFPFRFLHNLAS
jgi:hypothetical protein